MKLESLIEMAEQPTTCAEGQMFREGLRQALEGWRRSLEDRCHNLKMLEPETEKWTTRQDMQRTRHWLDIELAKFTGKIR